MGLFRLHFIADGPRFGVSVALTLLSPAEMHFLSCTRAFQKVLGKIELKVEFIWGQRMFESMYSVFHNIDSQELFEDTLYT